MCATFHCIWRSGFKVLCTLVSALKSKMAAISMKTKRGKFFLFFSIFFHTDHNKCTMKWVGWKMSKTVFRPAPTLKTMKINDFRPLFIQIFYKLSSHQKNLNLYISTEQKAPGVWNKLVSIKKEFVMLMLLLFIFLGPKTQILPQGRKSAKFTFFQRKSCFSFTKNM